MLVEFRCGNYSRFDEVTGQNAVCGQRMSAAVDDVGLLVQCPRCKQGCEVPSPQTSNSGSAGKKKLEKRESSRSKKAVVGSAPSAKQQRCPKCGGLLDQRGVCDACRWVKPRFAKANQSLDEMDMEPAGMMLWFAQIMSEGVSMKILIPFAHVLITLFFAALMVVGLVVLGGLPGGFLFLLSFLSLSLYCCLSYKGYQFLRDGNAQLAWFQKPLWFGILGWCRSQKWQGLDSKTRNRNVVDHRGKPVTDEKLILSPEFKSAQILDLEGTLVTDATIEQIYKLKHLQCLVVKGTKVSNLAVTRLQQSFPKLWIWH